MRFQQGAKRIFEPESTTDLLGQNDRLEEQARRRLRTKETSERSTFLACRR